MLSEITRDLKSFPVYCFPLFLCIVHLRPLISPCSSLESSLVGCIFPLLLFLLLPFFPQLSVKPPQAATLPPCISFFRGRLLVTASSTVLQALCLLDLIPWIYSSPPLYNHKGFDLGHTGMAYWFPYFLQVPRDDQSDSGDILKVFSKSTRSTNTEVLL